MDGIMLTCKNIFIIYQITGHFIAEGIFYWAGNFDFIVFGFCIITRSAEATWDGRTSRAHV